MNLAVVENQFKESLAQIFDGMAAMPAENLLASSKEMTSIAKKLNGMIDSLTAVEVRNKKGDGKKFTFGNFFLSSLLSKIILDNCLLSLSVLSLI